MKYIKTLEVEYEDKGRAKRERMLKCDEDLPSILFCQDQLYVNRDICFALRRYPS
jgi:hypothetical protein